MSGPLTIFFSEISEVQEYNFFIKLFCNNLLHVHSAQPCSSWFTFAMASSSTIDHTWCKQLTNSSTEEDQKFTCVSHLTPGNSRRQIDQSLAWGSDNDLFWRLSCAWGKAATKETFE